MRTLVGAADPERRPSPIVTWSTHGTSGTFTTTNATTIGWVRITPVVR